ncbi:MAG: hypothetical protein EOO05_17085 [Chitinophagaceae bacterium]|nr:MAG: hypothetical protein EOO05_17085 [Chitinophagaceae bacterium]
MPFRIQCACCAIASILLFVSCSSSPQDKIVNRWKPVDQYGSEAKKEKFKSRMARHVMEWEFTKDGKFNGYSDGVLQGTADYTMASDGKSVVIKDGGMSESIKIIKLTSNMMEVQTDILWNGRDTVILKAQ